MVAFDSLPGYLANMIPLESLKAELRIEHWQLLLGYRPGKPILGDDEFEVRTGQFLRHFFKTCQMRDEEIE